MRVPFGGPGRRGSCSAGGGLVGDMCHAESGTAAYLEDPLPYVSRSQLWFPLMVGAGRLGPLLLLLPWFGSGT
jgi:hypothetical protein